MFLKWLPNISLFFFQNGYFLKGETCEKCNCLEEGSLDNDCNRVTGQCVCKSRVIGLDCDRCMGPFEAITRDCLGMCLCTSLLFL